MTRLARQLIRDESAAAAAELVLALPLLLSSSGDRSRSAIISSTSICWSKAFATARPMPRTRTSASSTARNGTVDATVVNDTQNIVPQRRLSGGRTGCANWGSATFTMSVSCVPRPAQRLWAAIMHSTPGGLVPKITVTATVRYSPVLGNLGFRPATLGLNASQQATVIGI